MALLLGAGAMGAMLGAAAYAVQSGPNPGLGFQIYFEGYFGFHLIALHCKHEHFFPLHLLFWIFGFFNLQKPHQRAEDKLLAEQTPTKQK